MMTNNPDWSFYYQRDYTRMSEICQICDAQVKCKYLKCSSCQFVSCKSCQFQYARRECASCHLVFTRKFIIDNIGAKFMTDVVKPQQIRELMVQQDIELPYSQIVADWDIANEAQNARKRFGEPPLATIRPVKDRIYSENFTQCPRSNCRGFVKGDECKTCRGKICQNCNEAIDPPEHKCNSEIVENLRETRVTTKACPSCCARIMKISGCDHMHCTNCGTHFSWDRCVKLATSTNAHYLHLRTFQRPNAPANNLMCDFINVNQSDDRIPFDIMIPLINEKNVGKFEMLITALYTNVSAVRLFKSAKFATNVLSGAYVELLDNMQVQFLRKKFNRKTWETRVYSAHIKHEQNMLYADVLTIYLSTIDEIQSELYAALSLIERHAIILAIMQIIEKTNELLALTNSSFQSIYDEYGGMCIRLKTMYDGADVPMIYWG